MTDQPWVLPLDVDITQPFYSTFGRREMEGAARLIVALLCVDNIWREFPPYELHNFACVVDRLAGMGCHVVAERQMGVFEYDVQCVGELIEYGWVEQLASGRLRVTPDFVRRLAEREQKLRSHEGHG